MKVTADEGEGGWGFLKNGVAQLGLMVKAAVQLGVEEAACRDLAGG